MYKGNYACTVTWKEKKKSIVSWNSRYFYQDYQEGLKHALSICSYLGIQLITTTHQESFLGKSDWLVMRLSVPFYSKKK